MMLSAEMRWFWRGAPPPPFEAWFAGDGRFGAPALAGEPRTDEYLRPTEPVELGIKKRGSSGTEIKGLVVRRDRGIELGGLAAPVEIWSKWTVATLDLAGCPLLRVGKRRWVRRYEPAQGRMREMPAGTSTARPGSGSDCYVELTLLTAPDGSSWWTLGLEAHATIEAVEATLAATVALLQAARPPPLSPGRACNYPTWLSSERW